MDLGLGFHMIGQLRPYLLILSLLASTSCLKPPALDTDNGPVATHTEVQKAILEAWDDADFHETRQGEFLYIEQDNRISTLEPRVVYKEGSDVKTRVVDNANQTIAYKFEIQSTEVQGNGSFKPITVVEDNMVVPITTPVLNVPTEQPAQQTAAFPDSVEALQQSMANGSVGLYSSRVRNHFIAVFTIENMLLACVKDKDWDVTCHNLEVTEGMRAPPIGVSSQPNCGGIPNCLIRYKKIAFDLVVNLKDEETGEVHPERVNYELVLSPDVPYLSRLLDFCYQGMVPTQGQKVLVKMCNKVKNFVQGTPH
ncbi:hypothetical protein [Bdellovibrio sp. HCB337]|uniref:hypothetical protein n=1 Tax=Bdellovibrio sp. HCB337 TaxID=3394358 RepID=UPI0039A663D2